MWWLRKVESDLIKLCFFAIPLLRIKFNKHNGQLTQTTKLHEFDSGESGQKQVLTQFSSQFARRFFQIFFFSFTFFSASCARVSHSARFFAIIIKQNNTKTTAREMTFFASHIFCSKSRSMTSFLARATLVECGNEKFT
jgi:hypothetical protein